MSTEKEDLLEKKFTCLFHFCKYESIDKVLLLKHLTRTHWVKLELIPGHAYNDVNQCIFCGKSSFSLSRQEQLNHWFMAHGIEINQPRLQHTSSTAMFDSTVAKKLTLTSWLMQVPLMLWTDMETISQYDQASSFDIWFDDLLNVLNTVATSMDVLKDIRTYARHLRDYNNLKKSMMEQYWLKARIAQRESTESDDDDSQASTPPGTDSLVVNRKQKHHENYETPESIKHYIADIKASLKLKEIERGTAKLRGSDFSSRIPSALSKLLTRGIAYCDEKVVFKEDHLNSSIAISHAEDQIDAMITKYSSKFVLAIIQSTSSWALITHLDAFYQRDSSADDCALPPNTNMDVNAKAMLLQKTEGSYNYKELVIQCGAIQLLAIGGYYGQIGSTTKKAFLGSALPKGCNLSMDETFNIMIPLFPAQYTRTIRHLRNYTKVNAGRLWSFGSEEFQRQDFLPCHPLFYDSHPKRVNCKRNAASIASLLLRCVAVCKFSKQDHTKIEKVFASIPEISRVLSKWSKIPPSLVELKPVLEKYDAKSSIMSLLDFAIRLEQGLADREEIELNFMSEELSATALLLYKSYLAHSVKEVNKKVIKSLIK
ncbi:hypothetical protein INT44_006696 [Umbelopsis vinacea]|uniref:Uncharacterized protein n=1 Tax=Umbelopsis vinacea TaxID=44442 RepID=A0A8H7U6T8_9FUNG|nr:hypothetical protein INT44_006696 [Umbelopsis vinacea]